MGKLKKFWSILSPLARKIIVINIILLLFAFVIANLLSIIPLTILISILSIFGLNGIFMSFIALIIKVTWIIIIGTIILIIVMWRKLR